MTSRVYIHTDEHKKKISVILHGRKKSKEWIEKIRRANKGKPSPRKGIRLIPIEIQKERRKKYIQEWKKQNHDKLLKYGETWRENNREKINAGAKERYYENRNAELSRHRFKNYGIDNDTYNFMVNAQDGRCIICGDMPEINLSVDHNHQTGKIRRLICNPCNIAIAKAKDSPEILRAMADYLEKYDD